jgi:hypothetical protein
MDARGDLVWVREASGTPNIGDPTLRGFCFRRKSVLLWGYVATICD